MVTGELLAMHPYQPHAEQQSRWNQIVLDEGRTDRARPWLVRTAHLGAATVGDVVRLRAQPWTRYGLGLVVVHSGRTATADRL